MGYDLRERVVAEVDRMSGRVFRKVEDLGFVDWCEKYISYRQTETKDYAGKYSRRVTVAMGRLWELFLDSDEWSFMALTKGGQSTASAHAICGLARKMANDPCNVVYAIHSQDEATNIGQRVRHILEDCPETAGMMEETSEDDKSRRTYRLPGGNIWLVGSGSAGAMASKPSVGMVIVDEVDKHPEIKGEADSIDLLKVRGKAVRGMKVVAFSTPTTDDGQISRAVRSCSEHKYFMPCPSCTEFFVPEKDHLKFSHLQDLAGGYDYGEVKREAYLECPLCKARIKDESKEDMILGGEWRATNYREVKDADTGDVKMVPGWKPGEMSAYHNDFLALWAGSTYGDLALEIISAGNKPKKVHDLLNNRFGLPWKQGGVAAVVADHIYSLRSAYNRGGSLFEPEFVTFGADTQDDCWKWMICAWNSDRDCCVSDWGYCISWEDLLVRARDGIEFNGKNYRANFCLVDEGGHRTWEVRRNSMVWKPWLFPSKGLGGINARTILDWKMFNVAKDGAETTPVLVYDDDSFKREMYRQYIYESARRQKLGKKFGGDSSIYFPSKIEKEVVEELCQERYEKVHSKWKWVEHGVNDFGDALKENFIAKAAAAHIAMPDK